jgi:hypothetical protein
LAKYLLFICKQFYKYQKNKELLKEFLIKALTNFNANSLNTNKEEVKFKFKINIINKFTENINPEDYINFSI